MNVHIQQHAVIMIGLTMILSACEPEPYSATHVSDSAIIAQTDHHTFYEEDLVAEIHSLPPSLQYLAEDPEVRAKILHAMIRRSIISEQAIRLEMDADPQLQHQIQQAKDQLLIEHLQQWRRNWMPKITPEDVEAYYQHHLQDFILPEQRHVRHILFKDKKSALKVLQMLQRGGRNFEEMVAEYSVDYPTKENGGNLNWFTRGVMVKPFEEAVFQLKNIGERAGPFKTKYGWHIVEMLGERPETIKPLADVQEEIIALLQQQSLDSWMDSIVNNSEVIIYKKEYELSSVTPTSEDQEAVSSHESDDTNPSSTVAPQ
ncbi:MAG: peptidylprolyl isomerase [Zetaproteobacteria bacterium]|nr:peptidylprolyl isomerase [Zetaproteobacteria bacterium]